MVATKSVEQNNKVTVTSDSSLYYSSLAKKYADEAKIAESNITELLEDAVNTAVTSANTATEKANMAGAEVEKAKVEVEKVTETVQNSLTNIESKTLEGINKIKQTGFYMEGDKLYYIDSNGETKEFKSTGTTACQYGMNQYYKGIMNSGAWLRSNGQWNNKSVYEGLYNWALTQLNAGVEGFKSSTASDITDYDFVINTTDETFRLPLIGKRVLVESKKPTDDDKTWYNLYSDGWCEQGGDYNGSATTGRITLFKNYKDKDSYQVFTQVHFDASGYGYQIGVFNKSINGFNWGSAGSNYKFNWQASGYVNLSIITSDYNLYYYCGNVEENPQLVNVARIEEALVDKVDVANSQWATNACTPDYSAGIALTSATLQGFVTPSDGVITGAINWESSTKYLKVNGYDVLGGNTETSSVYISLAKGDKLSYNAGIIEANITRLYFYPLKGANNV